MMQELEADRALVRPRAGSCGPPDDRAVGHAVALGDQNQRVEPWHGESVVMAVFSS